MTAEIIPFPNDQTERVVAVLIRGITIVSRDDVAEELVRMTLMLSGIRDLGILRAIQRIDCDSRASALYEIQLRTGSNVSPWSAAKWVEHAAIIVHGGHNGILVEAHEGESADQGAFWIGDDDIGLHA